MSSNFTLGGLDPLAKSALHLPGKIKYIGSFSECHAIVTTSGYSEPETCRNIIYITWNVDVCSAPTAVCSSSPHSRPRWLHLMLVYTHMYTLL